VLLRQLEYFVAVARGKDTFAACGGKLLRVAARACRRRSLSWSASSASPPHQSRAETSRALTPEGERLVVWAKACARPSMNAPQGRGGPQCGPASPRRSGWGTGPHRVDDRQDFQWRHSVRCTRWAQGQGLFPGCRPRSCLRQPSKLRTGRRPSLISARTNQSGLEVVPLYEEQYVAAGLG